MSSSWSALATLVGAHPGWTGMAVASLLAFAWAAHLWRLRQRERDLLRLVDRRTRQWQDEVHAHARFREQMGLRARPRGAEGLPPPGPDPGVPAPAAGTARVLVVGDRADERSTLASLFGSYGVTPVFADSEWAGAVAAAEANEQGDPYDLIVVAPGMPAMSAPAVVLPRNADRVLIGQLLERRLDGTSEQSAAAPTAGGVGDPLR